MPYVSCFDLESDNTELRRAKERLTVEVAKEIQAKAALQARIKTLESLNRQLRENIRGIEAQYLDLRAASKPVVDVESTGEKDWPITINDVPDGWKFTRQGDVYTKLPMPGLATRDGMWGVWLFPLRTVVSDVHNPDPDLREVEICDLTGAAADPKPPRNGNPRDNQSCSSWMAS